MVKNHLDFVLANLWIKGAIENKHRIKFIIVCSSCEDDKDEDDLLNDIQTKLKSIGEENEDNMD